LPRPGLGRQKRAVVENSGFEPCPQGPTQPWTRLDCGQERVLCAAVEAVCAGGVQYVLGLLAQGRAQSDARVMTGAPRSEARAVGGKARFPCRFHRALAQRVAGAIGHGRHAPGAWCRRRAGFGHPDSADGSRGPVEAEGLCQRQALGGGRPRTPSTPAVRLPRLSWVTRLTDKRLAEQACLTRRWRLRTVWASPRRAARSRRFCGFNTCRWLRVQGMVCHPSIGRGTGFIACPRRLGP
jgi:hypothetical protein